MNENITSKVRKTIRRYLELRSYEVLEDGREACARSSTETETCLASIFRIA